MRLSCDFIVNYANINQFSYENQWKMRAGDPTTLFFQLTDLDQGGLRYLMGIGMQNQPFSVMVSSPSIDQSKVLQFQAIQVDSNDSSIWKIVIAPTQIPSSGNVNFFVSQGNNTWSFKKENGLHVTLVGNDGMC